jgi:hypothetical protein
MWGKYYVAKLLEISGSEKRWRHLRNLCKERLDNFRTGSTDNLADQCENLADEL